MTIVHGCLTFCLNYMRKLLHMVCKHLIADFVDELVNCYLMFGLKIKLKVVKWQKEM